MAEISRFKGYISAYRLQLLASILGIGIAGTIPAANAQQVVSHTQPDTNTIIWRIDQPVVNQPDTPYPEIRFQPLDKVTVQAGGCVQTGGHGKTWKRYVDPDRYTGGDADRLYRGLITIPTVPPGPDCELCLFAIRPGFERGARNGHLRLVPASRLQGRRRRLRGQRLLLSR